MSSFDKLTIETPEQTALEFPLAGIGSRFLALAADTLLQLAVAWVLVMVFVVSAVSLSLFSKVAGVWTFAILVFAIFGLQFGYFALFESIWNGQTPGKRWTHLRVIKDSGRPITAYDAILRNLLRIVDTMPTMYATGLITMLISRENKRVGDYAAGTVVIHEKPLQGVSSIWQQSATPAQPPAGIPLPQLNVEELQLIEAFLDRRGSLDPQVRSAMARQIADRLAERWSIPAADRPDAEKFLELAAEQRRQTARFR
ncbi:MAG TPA: RDD family protein [Candidatus Baltobacteraceae bacterium]|jgi:uncharacterized RDD family membrane protein YckC|nr:RDD family protein [Candidatus Baltobacteraceae bacterium]